MYICIYIYSTSKIHLPKSCIKLFSMHMSLLIMLYLIHQMTKYYIWHTETISNANVIRNAIFGIKYSNMLNFLLNLNFYSNAQCYFKCCS